MMWKTNYITFKGCETLAVPKSLLAKSDFRYISEEKRLECIKCLWSTTQLDLISYVTLGCPEHVLKVPIPGADNRAVGGTVGLTNGNAPMEVWTGEQGGATGFSSVCAVHGESGGLKVGAISELPVAASPLASGSAVGVPQGSSNGPLSTSQGSSGGPFGASQGLSTGPFSASQGSSTGPIGASQRSSSSSFGVSLRSSSGAVGASEASSGGPVSGLPGGAMSETSRSGGSYSRYNGVLAQGTGGNEGSISFDRLPSSSVTHLDLQRSPPLPEVPSIPSPATVHDQSSRTRRGYSVAQVQFTDPVNRCRTFTEGGWPTSSPVSVDALVDAGFYYIGPADRVRCAYCKKKIHQWEEGDDVAYEHKRISPFCEFAQNL